MARMGVERFLLMACALSVGAGCPAPKKPPVAVLSVSITIAPEFTELFAGQTRKFTATVEGSDNTAVTWAVEEGAAGGTVTAEGEYQAPGAAGIYHVTAASDADPSQVAKALVTVLSPVEVSIAPQAATLNPGQTQDFVATVTGADAGVVFSVQESDGGAVDSTGTYTAPAGTGTFHVVASAVADPTKKATAEVVVTSTPVVGVSISPKTVTLGLSGVQTFTATVSNSLDPTVTWSVREGAAGGTVVDGNYTAPATPGVYHVVATAKADTTKSAAATVTVTSAPVVSVSVSPPVATVSPSATQQFSATVTGNSNTAVSWSVEEAGGGSVDATGLYTAPRRTGSYHVVAKSQADATKSARATVTVALAPLPTLSGQVFYAGTQQGRVYVNVAVAWGGGSPSEIAGTSLDAPGPFTVRGIQGFAGVGLVVTAFVSTLGGGVPSILDPSGFTTLAFPVPTSNMTGVNITLNDPPAQQGPPPMSPLRGVFSSGTSVMLGFESQQDQLRRQLATEYRVYWSTTANPGPNNKAASPLVVPASALSLVAVRNLAQGNFYFGVSAVREGAESGVSTTPSPVVVGATTAGVKVAGTVTFSDPPGPGLAPPGLLEVVIYGDSAAYFAEIASPTSPQAFSIQGVADGEYRTLILRDLNGDGVFAPTEPARGFANTGAVVKVQGADVNGLSLTLPGGNARTSVMNDRSVRSPGNTDSFGISFVVQPGFSVPVRATLMASPNVPVPIDLALTRWQAGAFATYYNVSDLTPVVGEKSFVQVMYADGGTEVVTGAITAVFGGVPTGLSPSGTISDPNPNFTWTPPTGAPAGFTQGVRLEALGTGGGTLGEVGGLDGGVNSLPRTALSPNPLGNGDYRWRIRAEDADGNSASAEATFTR